MIRLLLASSLLGILLPTQSWADGFLLPGPGIHWDGESDWRYHPETDQQAHILYQDGIERLTLRIGIDDAGDKGLLWIFPVPADPSKVTVDMVEKFPRFAGTEIKHAIQEEVFSHVRSLYYQQANSLVRESKHLLGQTFLGIIGLGIGELAGDIDSGSPAPSFSSRSKPDVVVHQRKERFGLVSELLTARTPDGLLRYLRKKGFKFKDLSNPVLAHYIGKEYSFVATWIGDSMLPSAELGVSVSFPTDSIYFPLIPTSVYGERKIPISIQVTGFVTPKVPPGIETETKVKFYIEEKADYKRDRPVGRADDSDSFWRFTQIEINAPAESFTEDLWIDPHAPLKPRWQAAEYAVIKAKWFYWVFKLAAGLLAGLLAGWLAFKDWRNPMGLLKMAGLSLCNLLPVLGLPMMAALPTRKLEPEEHESPPPTSGRLRRWSIHMRLNVLRAFDRRKLIFIPVFAVLFLFILQLFFWTFFGFQGPVKKPTALYPPNLSLLLIFMALAFWTQVWTFLFTSGTKNRKELLKRYWLSSHSIPLIGFSVLIITRIMVLFSPFDVFDMELSWLLAFGPWGVLPILVWSVSVLVPFASLFLLLPSLALSFIDPADEWAQAKAALTGLLWGVFFAPPFPHFFASWSSLWFPCLCAALAWILLKLRASWNPRSPSGAIKPRAWLVARWSLLLLLAIYGISLYSRIPQHDWSIPKKVEAFQSTDLGISSFAYEFIRNAEPESRKEVVSHLLPLLSLLEKDPNWRNDRVLWTLFELASLEESAENALLDFVNGETQNGPKLQARRKMVVMRLGASERKETILSIAKFLDDRDPDMRRSAILGLFAVSSTTVKAANAWSDSEKSRKIYSEGRLKKWELLERYGIAPALIKTLRDKDPQVRYDSVRKFQDLVERPGMGLTAVKSNELFAFLREILETHPNPAARHDAATLLGWSRSKKSLPALKRSLRDRDPRQRLAALGVADELAAIASPFFAPIIKDRDSKRRARVRRSIPMSVIFSESNHLIAPEALRLLKDDPAPEIRKKAAEILAKRRYLPAVPAFIKALKDKDSGVRLSAIKGLGLSGAHDDAAVSALLALLQQGASRHHRETTLGVLGESRNPKALPALINALDDPDYYIRKSAVASLGAFGPTAAEAVPAIIRAVDKVRDEESRYVYESFRRLAQKVLPRIGAPEGNAALERYRREQMGEEGKERRSKRFWRFFDPLFE